MKIAIAFTMKDLPELTKQAFDSINSKYPYEVIMVDDWSEQPTKEWLYSLDHYLNVHTIIDPLTLSLAEKWNLAAELAWHFDCSAILICNNDIKFHPVTIDALVDRWLIGDVAMVTAHNIRGSTTLEDLHHVTPPKTPTEAPNPDFSCFLLPKTTWDAVGEFDPGYQPCYFEDNDYHYRMKKLGLKAITTTAAIYYHIGSQTQNSVPGGLCLPPQFEKNRAYFVKKHGVDPSTYEPA